MFVGDSVFASAIGGSRANRVESNQRDWPETGIWEQLVNPRN